MPKLTDKIGSGMTERGVLRYDWNEPGDVQAQVQAAIITFERSSFARISARVTALASAILDAAGLPSDPGKEYLFSPEAGWAVIEANLDLGPELADARLRLDTTVMFCGYGPDSPEGYAARVLMLLQRVRDQHQAGSSDEALASAFAVGELVTEAAMKGVFERDFLAGADARDRMRKVQQKTYGTANEIEARDAAIRQAVDAALAQGFAKMKVYKAAARQFRTSESTVRRVVRHKNRPS